MIKKLQIFLLQHWLMKHHIYDRKWIKSKISKNKVKVKDLKKIKIEDALLKYYHRQITQIKVGLQSI